MQPQQILVIENDLDTLDMIGDMLHDAGYRTVRWNRGKDAFLHIRRNQPDLVILDLWLEERETGARILVALADDPTTKHIPVVICSANAKLLNESHPRFDTAGYSVLEKPFTPQQLLATVAAMLEKGSSDEAGS